MKPHFVLTLLFMAIVSRATDCEAGELAGVYVEKDATDHRIELVPDGTYYADPPYVRSGTYTKTNQTLTCIDKEDGSKTEFALKGENLVDLDGHPWVRRETLLAFPWKDAVPVSVVVVDDKTRPPIAEFNYTYRISTPRRNVRSAPRSGDCRAVAQRHLFSLGPEKLPDQAASRRGHDYRRLSVGERIRSDCRHEGRRIEATAQTGVLVEGVVVDAHTKVPISGPGFRRSFSRRHSSRPIGIIPSRPMRKAGSKFAGSTPI